MEESEEDCGGIPDRRFLDLEEKVRKLTMGLGFDQNAVLPTGMTSGGQSNSDLDNLGLSSDHKDLFGKLKKLLNKFLEEH